MSHSHPGGPHELGQNFLVDRSTIATIENLVTGTNGPIVELAAGDGAVTVPLGRSGRPITAVELDPGRARRLRRRTPEHVTVVNTDILRFTLPGTPHVLVGNLPFHLTTAVLKRVLGGHEWRTAVLLVQWEVARRRAGVGGATMLTAQWWPWYEFSLRQRVPAHAFRPAPSVDGGLLVMRRREVPLVTTAGEEYRRFVRDVYTGRGRGLGEILERTGRIDRSALREWLRLEHVSARSLPKELTAEQWASLWRRITATGEGTDEGTPHHRPGGTTRAGRRGRNRNR